MLKSTLLAFATLMAGAASAEAAVDYTPLHFRTVSGIRPFVDVQLNGKPFLFMVHANAGFYAMTTHENAGLAGISGLVAQDHYGIASPGHVSDLGRAKGVAERLQVGADTVENAPLLVFEVPQVPPMQGMLGVRWLRARRVIMDYDRSRLGVPGTPADGEAEDRRLIAEGFVPHPMRWDEEHARYTIRGTVNGVDAEMNVSTVAQNVLDIEFAKKADVPIGPAVDEYGGPKGSLGQSFIARKPVAITIDGQKAAAIQPLIWDTYDYDTQERSPTPDASHIMMIGADFMLANQVVLDFGTGTLLIRPAKEAL